MSSPVLYDSRVQKMKDGKRCVEEHFVIVGEKGIKIKYFKHDDKKREKIVITGKNDQYDLVKSQDDVKVESTIDTKGLAKELESNKLKFAKDYLSSVIKVKSAKEKKESKVKPVKTTSKSKTSSKKK